MKQGLKRQYFSDHRDYDFIKSHKLYGAVAPTEYKEFDISFFPPRDQNKEGYPLGCSGYSQGELCSNEDKIEYDPGFIYNHTPPFDNAEGREMRASLKIVCSMDLLEENKAVIPNSKRKGYFSIRAQGFLDWFDAIYVSMLSTLNENRNVSIGIPWFPDWENLLPDAIMPMPSDLNTSRASWHNAVIVGLKLINGQPYFKIDSHQGTNYGDKGFCYMGKDLANKVFDIYGTEAFTVSKVMEQPMTIDLSIIETIVSFVLNLLNFKKTPDPITPMLTPTPTKTPEQLYEFAHSFLDTDPTPHSDVDNEVACVDTLSTILNEFFSPDQSFPHLISTVALYGHLREDTRFVGTLDLTPGNVILSVTGTGNGTIENGHCGILGENGTIMSNDSRDGKWRTNYSVQSWVERYRTQGGMKVRVFSLALP